MFGNLFFEDDTQQGPSLLPPSSVANAPPSHRLECGLAGIDNQGATCYLNSLLQTLLLTPEFREKLFHLSEEELGRLQDKDSQSARVRVIPLHLQRLFAQLLLCNRQSVSTVELTNSFGWTNREEFQQHDVQELNRILFSAIEDSLMGTEGQNIIHQLYHGTIVNQIICSRCKKVSEREEDFLDLTLAVAGASGLQAALKQCYCDVEIMNGCNQYRCEKCGTYTDATKGAKLRNLPPILTVSLLRFSYDFVKNSRYKENGRFTFPFQLDMTPYSDQTSDNKDKDNLYDLFSVVVHRGGAYGGHYFAYIKDTDNLGQWSNPDATQKKSKVDPAATGLDVIECQHPSDLIENILGKAPHNSMSIDRLCAEMSKVTGVSWNKRFKKQHGPINKFLKSCDEFEYNADANWVSLKAAGAPKSEKEEKENFQSQGNNKMSSEQRNVASGKEETSKATAFAPEVGQCWYCFNDSRVSPILAKEIERQFAGKESAYMLFYRKSSLKRPEEALGQAAYMIPNHLLSLVDDMNLTLEKQRQEYEISVNNICVKISQPANFTFDKLLYLKPSDECVYFEVEMDKRRKFGELRDRVQEKLPNASRLCCHRMINRFGGFHLYDEFSNDDATLEELGIGNDAHLFFWNGSVVDDQFVQVGEDCEPIKVVVQDKDYQLLAEVIVMKNETVSDLKDTIINILGSRQVGKNICQLTQAQDGGDMSLASLENKMDLTLSAAGLSGGDVVVLAGDSTDAAMRQNSSQNSSVIGNGMDKDQDIPSWSITLQNRLQETERISCETVQLHVKTTISVKDLKWKAMDAFGVSGISPETARIREDHPILGLQPPLKEALSLVDAGLSNGAVLVLESGRPPQETEMTVMINRIASGKLVSKQEFLVDRQLTVLGMVQAACRLMNCHDSQWFLSKTDAFGDPSDPLDDDSATLMDLLINDGDTLVLQEGSIVRKDQTCINFWLVKETFEMWSAETLTNGHSNLFEKQEEDQVILDLALKLSMEGNGVPATDLNPLNACLFPKMQPAFNKAMIVPKAMTMEGLKEALMSTEFFQTLRIPTCKFMRLRNIEDMRPKTVVRNQSMMLRHTNAKDTLSVAVEVLPHEETLGVHEMLLYLAFKVSGSRIYRPAKEFVWSTSSGLGANDLKRVIATRFALPIHDVLLAKYNIDTATWTVIKEVAQKTHKNKGRKKSNIRQAPYSVQDGDLIGVKLISADKGFLAAEDFSTQEDIDKRKALEQIAQEKKRQREEKKTSNWMDGVVAPKRQEVPLMIKVDKFS